MLRPEQIYLHLPAAAFSIRSVAKYSVLGSIGNRELRAVPHSFHGGEPLLANGTLLTQEWCEFLLDLGIPVGVGIDGSKTINDSRRVDHFGRGFMNAFGEAGISLSLDSTRPQA